jgi:thymidylate synthase
MDSSRHLQLVRAHTIGQCWLDSIRFVLDHGAHHHDEDVGLLEVLGVAVEILKPAESDPVIDAHGDKTMMARTFAKFAKGASAPDRPFTYGERIYDMSGVDQFEWMVDRLRRKPDTKSATIGLLLPGSTSANLPCLTTVDAKIRHERLDLQFFFRSQNIFGRQYANLAALARLQNALASRCGASPGALRGYVASAHIYAFDLDEARRICVGEAIEISDRYYVSGPRSIRTEPHCLAVEQGIDGLDPI